MTSPVPTPDDAIALTRVWIERAVIGLNLCPFARAVHVRGQIRYTVSEARDTAQLLADLEEAMHALIDTDAGVIDTTLLIHPYVLTDFLDCNDFLGVAEDAVERLGLTGVLQIASFHPAYRFAGVRADDVTNNTNRSPFPTLHLLRETSMTKAVASLNDPQAIYKDNKKTMRRLGEAGWRSLGITPERS